MPIGRWNLDEVTRRKAIKMSAEEVVGGGGKVQADEDVKKDKNDADAE